MILAFKSRRKLLVIITLMIGLLIVMSAKAVAYRTLERVSIRSNGAQTVNGDSQNAAISADGRYVAFQSDDETLVTGDSNTFSDIFLHDRETGTTIRVSRGLESAQPDGDSSNPAISANGRYIAFESDAKNLVVDDLNAQLDIFVYDRDTQITTRVSVGTGGVEGTQFSYSPSISADGQLIAFASYSPNLVTPDSNSKSDIFVYDLTGSSIERISSADADDAAFDPFISADGRYVAYRSLATNLVENDANDAADIFLFDRLNLTTVRVSVNSSGEEANGGSATPSLSGDGRYVVFESAANNLVTGDSNGVSDIFLHDTIDGSTLRVNHSSGGQQAFDGGSSRGVISADGQFVAFVSLANTLVQGDNNEMNDIFVRSLVDDTTVRANVNNSGQQAAGGHSARPAISADGTYVTFHSGAVNLVTGDSNGLTDIFVARQRATPNTPEGLTAQTDGETRIALTWDDVLGETGYRLEWSADGENDWVIFGSTVAADVMTTSHNGLNCATTYYYRAAAFNELGDSAYTNVASAATAPCVIPTTQLVKNGGFEKYNGKSMQPNVWKANKLTGDRVRCNTANVTRARSGKCAYTFRGGKFEGSSLVQNVNLKNNAFTQGDSLALSAYMFTKKTASNFRVQLQVRYKGGLPNEKIVLKAAQGVTYVYYSDEIILAADVSQLKKVRVMLTNNSPTGIVYLDDVSLLWRKAADLIASPEMLSLAADTLRGNETR